MTELDKIIRSRKSMYPQDFSEENITQEELENLLSLTAYAPNHKKTMPWRFQVFRGSAKAALGQKLFDLYKENTNPEKFSEKKQHAIKAKVDNSNVVICIVHEISQSVPEWEEHAAIAMSIQNMWLKATELGFSGYWSTTGLRRHLDEFLELEESQNCLGLFFLGKVKDDFPVRDYDWKKFVTFKD